MKHTTGHARALPAGAEDDWIYINTEYNTFDHEGGYLQTYVSVTEAKEHCPKDGYVRERDLFERVELGEVVHGKLPSDALRTELEKATTVLVPVLRRDGSTTLLGVSPQDVIDNLNNYAGDAGASPWGIDHANSDKTRLTLDAAVPAPVVAETEIRLGGVQYVCTALRGDGVVFRKRGV